MSNVPDASQQAAVLVPLEKAGEHLRQCCEAVDKLRTTVFEALSQIDADLGKALRAYQLARCALLAHQAKPGEPSTPDPGGLY